MDSITTKDGFQFCDGDSIQLSVASGYESYVWSDSVTSSSRYIHDADTLSVIITNKSGCSAKIDNVVTEKLDNPVVSISATSNIFCEGDSVMLKGNGAKTYMWSTKKNDDSIKVSRARTYYLTGKDSSNCLGYDSIVTQHYESPKVAISSISDTLCEGDIMVLSASGAKSYLWSTQELSDSIQVSSGGEYYLAGKDSNNCLRYDTLVLKQVVCIDGISESNHLPFKAYPIPVTNKLKLIWNATSTEVLDLTCRDISGKPVLLSDVNFAGAYNGELEINTSTLSGGVYLLEIYTPSGAKHLRFIKN